MNNSNEVIMIYANADKKDIGVLQDYSFDMCYGVDENNFECKLQKYNLAFQGDDPIDQDFILYIEFTEYGGLIDRKEINTKTGEIILSGRTWHGFLNSYVIEPKKGEVHRAYSGEANSVMRKIITDIGMTDWFEVVEEDSGITIKNTKVRYKNAYDTIIKLLESADAKLVMWYESEGVTGGKIKMQAVSRVNTGAFEEFDTSQMPFRAGKTFNNINELVCLGPGSGLKRAVIHLYANKERSIIPYCKPAANKDSDYFTDISALADSPEGSLEKLVYDEVMESITPISQKRSMIYDYPNAEIVTSYERVYLAPANWKGVYTNYYYLDYSQSQTAPEYVKFKRQYKDEYNLLYSKPSDWKTHYKDYYMLETMGSTSFKKVEELSESQGAQITYTAIQSINRNKWRDYFEFEYEDNPDVYYERVGMYGDEYKKVEPIQEDEYVDMYDSSRPFDWESNYGSYYLLRETGTGQEYFPVPGVSRTSYMLHTNQPYDWHSNYGSYYMKATTSVYDEYRVRKIKKGQYITVSTAIQENMIDDYYYDQSGQPHEIVVETPQWKRNTFYTKVTSTDVPEYHTGIWTIQDGDTEIIAHGPFYKVTTYKAPTFVAGKYYTKYVSGVPKWMPEGYLDIGMVEPFGGYYKKKSHVEQIPEFGFYDVFTLVEDRYAELCAAGVKRLTEIEDKDTMDVSLELESNFDVGDIISGINLS